MIAEARAYLAARTIVRREPLYSANRFARVIGDIPASTVTAAHLDQLRQNLTSSGLSARTIESTIADLLTVIADQTGSTPGHGHRLRLPKPRPKPVAIEVLNAIWPHCSPDLQSWLALTYWSGFRQSDGMRWLLTHRTGQIPPLIEWTASKTGKQHRQPLPDWLRAILDRGRYRFRTVSDFARRCIRGEIHAACLSVALEVWTPKQLRQASITEWTRANATAGAIIHGCGLRVLSHYIDPLSVLESAAPRIRLPVCFGACQGADSEATLLIHYRRIDPAAKSLLTGMAERLATG